MALFNMVMIEVPTKEQSKEGKLERVLVGPKLVVAADEQGAVMGFILNDAPAKETFDQTRARVIVSPFVLAPR